MEQMKPLMKMVFYCIDKLKRLKLSKEVPRHFCLAVFWFIVFLYKLQEQKMFLLPLFVMQLIVATASLFM